MEFLAFWFHNFFLPIGFVLGGLVAWSGGLFLGIWLLEQVTVDDSVAGWLFPVWVIGYCVISVTLGVAWQQWSAAAKYLPEAVK